MVVVGLKREGSGANRSLGGISRGDAEKGRGKLGYPE